MKKTIDEIRDWLLENAVSEYGNLNLSRLDFSNFAGDVYIDDIKVQRNLFQGSQKVQGSLYQDCQEVQGDLYQGDNKYGGMLIEYPSTKLLKEITLAELEELGYKLKENEE